MKDAGLFCRGLAWRGRRHVCPCCGWSLRGFVGPGGFLSSKRDGYCPRCNAKARHRRIWLYLEERTLLSEANRQVLEVAPWPSFLRRFRRMPNVRFVGLDIGRWGPQVTLVGDARAIPVRAGVFDLVLCVHVLEHVRDDRRIMAELHRVLKPGGVAIVSVPMRMDRPTHEDPAITDPDERTRVFGEPFHVRFYGPDIGDRLTAAGFDVTLDLAGEVPASTRSRFGLRDNEHIFHCTKPAPKGGAVATS